VSLVLCYHAVSAAWTPCGLSLAPEELERQLTALLRRGYRPGTMEEAVGSRRRLHVTFDDAYRSVETAVAVLERLGVPATVFACTGPADAGGGPLEIPELEAEAALFPAEVLTMDWEALRTLARRGFEVGSHTVTPPHLPRLDEEEIARELRESRARIEDELGRPCRYLAYPYGESDERVRRSARAAGYAAAFGLARGGRADRYALPRVGVYRRDSPLRLRLKTSTLVGARV
jgi:peptidoglycan/xylan/chitin deacetylase (PgdA/CDA1 family)